MKIPPLEVITTYGSVHSPTHNGTFQGLPSHILPSFQDILICLSNYLCQGRIAIIDSASVQIFNKTLSNDTATDHFRSKFVTDSVLTVSVKDKIYSVPITKFISASVIKNESVSSPLLPSLSFAPVYNVRNYETTHFSTKRQL